MTENMNNTQITTRTGQGTSLDVRNAKHFLEPISSLEKEGDAVLADIEARLKDLERKAELETVFAGMSIPEWHASGHQAEVNLILRREEPTCQRVSRFIENLRDLLSMLPLTPATREYRADLEKIGLIAAEGRVGYWDRAKRDMLILKARLEQLSGDIAGKRLAEHRGPVAGALNAAFDGAVDTSAEEEAFFGNFESGTPFQGGF